MRKYCKIHNLFSSKTKRINKKGKDITKTIFYSLQFIESARFMPSANLANNLAETFHKIKCKKKTNTKNENCVALNTKIATAFLNTHTLKVI